MLELEAYQKSVPKLAGAIVRCAIRDIVKYHKYKGRENDRKKYGNLCYPNLRRRYDNAVYWIDNNSIDYAFSFIGCCDLIDLDYRMARRQIHAFIRENN